MKLWPRVRCLVFFDSRCRSKSTWHLPSQRCAAACTFWHKYYITYMYIRNEWARNRNNFFFKIKYTTATGIFQPRNCRCTLNNAIVDNNFAPPGAPYWFILSMHSVVFVPGRLWANMITYKTRSSLPNLLQRRQWKTLHRNRQHVPLPNSKVIWIFGFRDTLADRETNRHARQLQYFASWQGTISLRKLIKIRRFVFYRSDHRLCRLMGTT